MDTERKVVDPLKNKWKDDYHTFKMMLEGARDGLWFWDVQKDIYRVTFQNTEIFPKTLMPGDESIEKWKSLVHPEDLELMNRNIENYLSQGEGIYENTYRVKDKTGNYRWIYSRGVGKTDPKGRVLHLAGSHTDITQQVAMNEKLFKMAYYDGLTELPNGEKARNYFNDLIGSSGEGNTPLAFIYVDIDHFSYINNTRGYSEGNQVLKEMADFLREILGTEIFLARVSADEFIILLQNFTSSRELRDEIQQYLKAFGNRKFGRDKDLSLTCSVGVAIYPKNGEAYDALIQRANLALYSAKKNGKNQCMFYHEEMSRKAYQRMDQFQQIKKGIENQEFYMVYQPIVEAIYGKIEGVEALIRWNHPQGSFISPAEFIPITEESALIVAIEGWILEEVHRQCARWKKEGIMPEFVSVNLSGRGLIEGTLMETLKDLSDRYNVPATEIELEITETAVMNSMDQTIKTLGKLKALGYRLALDDFGTGYSSLNYLNHLPFDRVKLDRSFINDIDKSKRQQFIVKAIINLCHNLDTEIIAEGVERETQLAILKKMDCDYIQGFLYGRPKLPVYLATSGIGTKVKQRALKF